MMSSFCMANLANGAHSLGDQIAFLSAYRFFARQEKARGSKDSFVAVAANTTTFFDIIEKFSDDLILSAKNQDAKNKWHWAIHIDANKTTDHGDSKIYKNYVGCYLGNFVEPEILAKYRIRPELPTTERKIHEEYIAFQPQALSSPIDVECILEALRLAKTLKLPIFAVGRIADFSGIKQRLEDEGLETKYCSNSPIEMFGLIEHCKCTFAPRSAGAHIAAAYNKKAFLLLPNDNLNWHLNYPDWNHVVRAICKDKKILDFEKITDYFKNLIKFE